MSLAGIEVRSTLSQIIEEFCEEDRNKEYFLFKDIVFEDRYNKLFRKSSQPLEHQYELHTAMTKDTAKHTLRKESIHMVLLDLVMPDVQDLELLDYIHDNFWHKKLIILYLIEDNAKLY